MSIVYDVKPVKATRAEICAEQVDLIRQVQKAMQLQLEVDATLPEKERMSHTQRLLIQDAISKNALAVLKQLGRKEAGDKKDVRPPKRRSFLGQPPTVVGETESKEA